MTTGGRVKDPTEVASGHRRQAPAAGGAGGRRRAAGVVLGATVLISGAVVVHPWSRQAGPGSGDVQQATPGSVVGTATSAGDLRPPTTDGGSSPSTSGTSLSPSAGRSKTPAPAGAVSGSAPGRSSVSGTTAGTGGGPAANFGVAAGGSIQLLDPVTMGARLDRMTGLGAGWVRFDISWSEVQAGGPSSWDWAPSDRLVAAARARGLRILAVVSYSPTWARTPSCASSVGCVPVDTQRFADFAGAASARYQGAGVHHWEVWNEPNLRDYWGRLPDPVTYTRLLKQTSAAIKAADPAAFVLTGGTARAYEGGTDMSPANFLAGIYDAGGRRAFDAVADHPYSFPVGPDSTRGVNAWRMLSQLRRIMTAAGDSSKKIWLTEYGAPTNGPGRLTTSPDQTDRNESDHVSESLQAKLLVTAVQLRGKEPWLGPLFFYADTDTGSDSSTSTEFYGVYRRDGSPKPALAEVRQAIARSGA